MNAEKQRLQEDRDRTLNWKRWGPYLSERQWGTVREDYSKDGNSWDAFSHDDARRRAYRWGEDGLQGWCDRKCRLCLSIALWNENDPILKERLYGLTGHQGNHGEDVKEVYFYKDSTPTHSYTKALYRYPQASYPYSKLWQENERRGRDESEFELEDTGVFDEDRFFDVTQEVAKRNDNDLFWRITVTNQGPEDAPLHILPTVWFRNTWRKGTGEDAGLEKPSIKLDGNHLKLWQEELGDFEFHAESDVVEQVWLFTENESDNQTLFGTQNFAKHLKDAFHKLIIDKNVAAISPENKGTKSAAHFLVKVPAGETITVTCRLNPANSGHHGLDGANEVFEQRIREADEFFSEIIPEKATPGERQVFREGYAGLLWTKQFYYYIIDDWLKGSKDAPRPDDARKYGRNSSWEHLYARDILSMPDKWEYPWFAAWDTAFHMIPFAAIDPDFAKHQLLLFLREWYMHPNGQIPAYEWNFSDVNPPVHAWAVWRVYKIADKKGERDLLFLERAFQKLLLNFTWWVNKKDNEGRHVFGGGFLGLDNIGIFDRSHGLPGGGKLNQADGTAWMASFCITMLSISLELAQTRPAYEDIASKFLEHYIEICDAINTLGGSGLWDEEDGFYYDQLVIDGEHSIPLKTRSLVGLLPIMATTVLKQSQIDALPDFKRRMEWFMQNRPDIMKYVKFKHIPGVKNPDRWLISIPNEDKLRATLTRMLDRNEFLSDFGIRSLSKAHRKEPFHFETNGQTYSVEYTPGESTTEMFGGNSNWRGPIWFPTNFVLIEALERYYYFYGDDFTIEYPTGSGKKATLREISIDLCDRLIKLFMPRPDGSRHFVGVHHPHRGNPLWDDHILFHEYFHAETGKGLGASHQTGWTSLVVRLIRERHEKLCHFDSEGS
ncbi:glucosidase [Akkermansiaceae bacterium]|nr:glucosidase [Akkermansiaceae bacterium]